MALLADDDFGLAVHQRHVELPFFVFREEYYLQNKEPKPGTAEHQTWQTDMEQVEGKAEVIIGKQRHGPTGTVELHFEANVTRFGDLAPDGQLPDRGY